jgi:hypothetical protein
MDTAADTAIAAASAMGIEVAMDTVAATAVGIAADTAADIAVPQLAADTTVAVVDSTVEAAVTVVVDTGNCSSVDIQKRLPAFASSRFSLISEPGLPRPCSLLR